MLVLVATHTNTLQTLKHLEWQAAYAAGQPMSVPDAPPLMQSLLQKLGTQAAEQLVQDRAANPPPIQLPGRYCVIHCFV